MSIRYAGYAKDKQIRDKSTSGGMSAIFAEFMIKQGGVVYGVSYSDDFRRVIYKRVDTMEDFFRYISTSKYSKCELPDMECIKSDLDNGLKVLFFGSGCIVRMLNDFLKIEYDNLVIVNIYCHGYSRPGLLNYFIEAEEKNEHSIVTSLVMRYKHRGDVYVGFENGKHHMYQGYSSFFFAPYNTLSECQECEYKYTHKNSDITLGDFWNYIKLSDVEIRQKFNANFGTNVIYANTEKGIEYFNNISSNAEFIKLTSDLFE